MCDGLAVRHLFRRAFGIDVDPLMVGRRFSELIDTVLVYDSPVRETDLLADQGLRIFDGFDDAQISFPSRFDPLTGAER